MTGSTRAPTDLRRRLTSLAASVTALLTAAAACTVAIPPPGSAAEQRVIAQGAEYDEIIRAQYGVYDDTELTGYVDRIGQRVAAESEWPGLPWTFRVLDSPVVNAFAVEGGYLYVTRGLLAHMNSEAELAGVLGHEVGHVTGRHAAEAQQRAMLANLGLMAGAAVSETFATRALQTGLAQGALGLFLLRYSRAQELESDESGIRYSTAAGYNPRGIAGFFATLQALERERGGRGVPGWAATHPEVDDRIARSEQWVAEALADLDRPASELIVGRRDHIRQVDNVVYGDNPRQGFFRDNLFLHPDLGFQLTLPKGWPAVNGTQALQALSGEEDALLQLALASPEEGESREAYVDRFLRDLGAVEVADRDRRVNGLWARQVHFTVADEASGAGGGAIEPSYEILGTWIWHRDRLYELLGVSTPARYDSYDDTFSASAGSFRDLTDRTARQVRPSRVTVTGAPRAMSLADLIAANPRNSLEPSTAAILNGTSLDAILEARALVKLVEGDGHLLARPPGQR